MTPTAKSCMFWLPVLNCESHGSTRVPRNQPGSLSLLAERRLQEKVRPIEGHGGSHVESYFKGLTPCLSIWRPSRAGCAFRASPLQPTTAFHPAHRQSDIRVPE